MESNSGSRWIQDKIKYMSVGNLSIILCILVLLEVIYFKIAYYFNIIDKPNHRSSHNLATIRGGGIIFGISILIFCFTCGFSYPYFTAGVFLISLISFLDDLITLNNKIRLFIHLLSVALLFYELNLFTLQWYWLFVVAVFVIGTINAYNFMDGINGITGAYSFLAIVTLYYIDVYVVTFVAKDFLLITGLALMVFNFFNFRKKAKCFAGDVGSIGIAFIILFLLLKLIIKTENFSYILLLLVYGLDAVSTITFRYVRKENIFEAHRSHFYQYWTNERNVPHLIVSGSYVLVQMTVNLLLLLILPNSTFLLCLTLFFCALIFIIIRFSVEGSPRLLGGKHGD